MKFKKIILLIITEFIINTSHSDALIFIEGLNFPPAKTGQGEKFILPPSGISQGERFSFPSLEISQDLSYPVILSQQESFSKLLDDLLDPAVGLEEKKEILDYVEFLSTSEEKFRAEPVLFNVLSGAYPLELKIRASRPLIFYGSTESVRESAKDELLEVLSDNLSVILRGAIDPHKGDYFDTKEYIYLFPTLTKIGAKSINLFIELINIAVQSIKHSGGPPLPSELFDLAYTNFIVANLGIILDYDEKKEILRELVLKELSSYRPFLDIDRLLDGLEEGRNLIPTLKGGDPRSLRELVTEPEIGEFYTRRAQDMNVISQLTEQLNYSNIVSHLYQLQKFGPRNVGSPGHREAENYIGTYLEDLGIDEERQVFFDEGEEIRNIIVRIPGKLNPQKKIILSAHYDTVEKGPGINDNGSGTAILMELARIIKESGLEFENTIEIIFFDAEETITNGSEYYVENLSAEDEIIGNITVDMVGFDLNGEIEITTVRRDINIFIDFLKTIGLATHFLNLPIKVYLYRYFRGALAEGPSIGGSDDESFIHRTFNSIGIEQEVAPPYYHSPFDLLPQYTDLKFFDKLARVILSSLLVFADPLSEHLELSFRGTISELFLKKDKFPFF